MAENKSGLQQWAAKIKEAMLRNLASNSKQADKLDEEAFQRSLKVRTFEPGKKKPEEEIEELE